MDRKIGFKVLPCKPAFHEVLSSNPIESTLNVQENQLDLSSLIESKQNCTSKGNASISTATTSHKAKLFHRNKRRQVPPKICKEK